MSQLPLLMLSPPISFGVLCKTGIPGKALECSKCPVLVSISKEQRHSYCKHIYFILEALSLHILLLLFSSLLSCDRTVAGNK